MALTLTIGGVDFMPQYKTNSAKVSEVLQHRGNSLSLMLTKKGAQTAPQEGKELIFKDGARYLFGGFITHIDPVEIGEGQLFVYRVEVMDYTYILANKSAQRSYSNQTLKYIVEDLLDEYVDSGYGFIKTGIQTGPTLETIAFDHIDLRTSFEKIAKETGYEFWISYDKIVNFKPKDYSAAPEQITDTSDNFESINIQYDTSQVRNSIVVKGGLEETSVYDQQTIIANGVAREWPLIKGKPTDVEYIKLNTVAQSFGEDPNDDEAGNTFMFGKEEKYIREIGTTTVDTDVIEVSYKYEIPIVILLANASSIAAMKAIEGGDGIHSYTIVNDQIKSKTEARQRAQKELGEYANPLVNAVFSTTSLLLGSGSIFTPGQSLTVNLPSWNISTDTKYLIQAVTIEILQDGTTIYYKYTVRFGGRVLDSLAFLESLAIKEEPATTGEIAVIKGITEPIEIVETIERDPNLKTITEEATVSEELSKTNFTPPFKWGGPELRFLFNEGADYVGSTVADDSENENDGTLTGGTFIDEGVVGGAIRQTGLTDKIELSSSIVLDSAFTVALWIKPSDILFNVGGLVADQLSYSNGRIAFQSNYTSIRFDNSTGNTNVSMTASWVADIWQHLIITRDASNNLKIYRNNIDITSGTPIRAGTFNINRVLDNPNNSSFTAFEGDADTLIIEKRVISSNERAGLYGNAPQAKWGKAEWG